MNAQAAQMTEMVDQLVNLVGNIGNGAGNDHVLTRRMAQTPAHRVPAVPVKRTAGQTLPQPRAMEVRPEQVIPMDDDFKDF